MAQGPRLPASQPWRPVMETMTMTHPQLPDM